MQLRKYILLTIMGMFFWGNANACTPLSPPTLESLEKKKASMWLSKDNRFLFKVIPAKWAEEKKKLVLKRESYTLAFELLKDGQLKKIWSMKGTFNSGYVSSDGLTLLLFHTVYSEKDEAVSIYRSGEKIRTFKSIDFGISSERLQPDTCGAGVWLKRDNVSRDQVKQYGDSISLTTVDDEKHEINLLTTERVN